MRAIEELIRNMVEEPDRFQRQLLSETALRLLRGEPVDTEAPPRHVGQIGKLMGKAVTIVGVLPQYSVNTQNPHCCQCAFYKDDNGVETCGLARDELCMAGSREVYKLLNAKD